MLETQEDTAELIGTENESDHSRGWCQLTVGAQGGAGKRQCVREKALEF